MLDKTLNTIINGLVAVGDTVLAVIFFPFLFVKGLARLAKRSLARQRLNGSFEIKKKVKSPPREIKPGEILKGAAKSSKKALSIFSLLSIFTFPFRFIARYFKRRKMASRARKKRYGKIKSGYYKPSIFYKLKYVFVGFIFSFIFLFLPLVSYLFIADLPNPAHLSANYIPKTTKIYDRNGKLLYEIYASQNRTVVSLSDVPKELRDATIAIEDKDFYNHPGFDLRGILRALVTNVRNRGFQGGSTITQQLIKSAFLSPDPTIIRKVREVVLAFWTERVYSKNEILELYLNYVPYGGTAWGVEAAADIYFGKKVQDLSLAECAFLAGLPQSPSTYSPFVSGTDNWKARQKEVLDAMVKQGYVSRARADAAYKQELVFQNEDVPINAPHFVMYVRKLLIEKYGISEVERGGLSVVTSLDLNIQNDAERIVSSEVEQNAYLNIGNGAALITDPNNGDILAMVGSRDYFDQEHDGNVNLTTATRQPGSSIKLITYALALSDGYTEASILDDTPLTIHVEGGPSYSPVNYDGAFHGKVPLRTAFANSFNIPPVRITQKLGADKVKDFGEKMGISSWKGAKNYGVSITLGGLDTKMTDLATAYGVVANEGNRVDLDPILEVKDSYGKKIYQKEPKEVQVVSPAVAYIISDILSDNKARSIEFGLNTPLNIPGAKVSVKTGTTDSKRDNWTIGYTKDVVVATWVGNNDNSPMNQQLASGITGAAPMWNKLMTMMLERTGTPSAMVAPPNIVKKYCLGQDRYFVRGTENSVNCRGVETSGTPSPSPQTN